MKRFIFTLAAFAAVSSAAFSQEAFKHLSAGIEIGTTGAGVEVAVPLVTNHIVLKAGYNFPSFSPSFNESFDSSPLQDYIDEANSSFERAGLSTRISSEMDSYDVNFKPAVKFGAAKLMLELYPSARSGFHFTLGAYYGMADDFISVDAVVKESEWETYNDILDEIDRYNQEYAGVSGYTPVVVKNLDFSLGKRTFRVLEKNGVGGASFNLAVNRLRPYAGIGFGKSIPDGHLGFQFDLGVWYHGVPSLSSPNEVAYDPEAESFIDDISIIDKAVIYPQMSIRLIYKIF